MAPPSPEIVKMIRLRRTARKQRPIARRLIRARSLVALTRSSGQRTRLFLFRATQLSFAYRKTDNPGKLAAAPNSSSILRSWLYYAVRSARAGAPLFSCIAAVATARSAMMGSVVSPERWEMTVV